MNLDLARELRKLWNTRVIGISITTGALGAVPKALERELKELDIGGLIEIIPTTALLKTT